MNLPHSPSCDPLLSMSMNVIIIFMNTSEWVNKNVSYQHERADSRHLYQGTVTNSFICHRKFNEDSNARGHTKKYWEGVWHYGANPFHSVPTMEE